MKINQVGLDLIKSFEGCVLTAYKDIVGVLTIGYGHTGPDVYEDLKISQQEAEELLKDDLVRFEIGVDSMVKVPMNENQFAALVSFAFNVGLANLRASTLLKMLNNKLYNQASKQFVRWDKAGGAHVPGLLRRREAERDLFIS